MKNASAKFYRLRLRVFDAGDLVFLIDEQHDGLASAIKAFEKRCAEYGIGYIVDLCAFNAKQESDSIMRRDEWGFMKRGVI